MKRLITLYQNWKVANKVKKNHKAKRKEWLDWANRIADNKQALYIMYPQTIQKGFMDSDFIRAMKDSEKDFKPNLEAWKSETYVRLANDLGYIETKKPKKTKKYKLADKWASIHDNVLP